MVFRIVQGDNSPSLLTTLSEDSNPIDLSNANDIRFIMQDRYERVVIDDNLQGNVNIVNPTSGDVEFVFNTSQTKTSGSYTAEFEVTYSNGSIETFPTNNKINIEIVEQIS